MYLTEEGLALLLLCCLILMQMDSVIWQLEHLWRMTVRAASTYSSVKEEEQSVLRTHRWVRFNTSSVWGLLFSTVFKIYTIFSLTDEIISIYIEDSCIWSKVRTEVFWYIDQSVIFWPECGQPAWSGGGFKGHSCLTEVSTRYSRHSLCYKP